MTKEEEIKDLERQIAELDAKAKEYHNLEQGIKLTLNSIYGAFGNSYCYFHNVDIAQCITAQGKDAILYTERLINKYFHEAWHKDKKAHKEMGIVVNKPCAKDVSVYIDTDSCAYNTLIDVEGEKITIEQFYNECIKYGSAGDTLSGHESVNCPNKILNYSDDKGLYYAPVKRIIRHKVNKKKWKLKTKSGKEVIVTNDHSLIVFRDGKQISVKPYEILKTDKVLSVQSVSI